MLDKKAKSLTSKALISRPDKLMNDVNHGNSTAYEDSGPGHDNSPIFGIDVYIIRFPMSQGRRQNLSLTYVR